MASMTVEPSNRHDEAMKPVAMWGRGRGVTSLSVDSPKIRALLDGVPANFICCQ